MSARELLLILRAQNQASGAVRRFANDLRGLGRIQELQLRRNQTAISQANIMRQRQRALNELESVTRGRRFLATQQEGIRLLNQQTSLRRSLANTTNQLAIAEKEHARRLRASGANALSTMRAAVAVERLRIRTMNYESQLKMLPSRLQSNAERMGDLTRRASLLGNELAILNQRNAELAKRMRIINKEISAARWDKAVLGARAIAHGGRLAQLAGLGLGAALGLAADAAAKFQERATLVATQTGRVGSGFRTVVRNAEFMRAGILRVMADSTSSMEQLSDAAYDIFSSLTLPAGGRGLNAGMAMLKQFSDAAVAGFTDVGTVGEGVIAVLNAFEEFKPTGGDVNRILNRMFAAVRFGRMSFAEFAQTLGTTAPAARAAGQSLDTMAGTIAFLSRPLGINKAAVGFARLTEILGRKKFVDNLKEAGVQVTTANGHMLQMPDIIENITKKFPALTKGGVKLVQFFKEMSGTEGTIQARRAFVFLAQQMDQYRTVLGQTVGDNNEFSRSLAAMAQTPAVRWRKALNQIRVLIIEIGSTVLPVLIQILEPIKDLVHWFQNLDKGTRDQIGRWLAWSAVVLLVGGTLAALVGTIGAIIATLGRLGFLFKSMTALIILAAAAVRALTGDFDSLKDAGSKAMDFMTGSWQGFLVGAALATAAILRVRTAMLSLTTAMAISRGGSAAAAGAGFLPMLIGRGRDAKAGLSAMRQYSKEGSKLTRVFRASAIGASLLPGPLKVAAVALAGFGVAALIWQRHAERMRRDTTKLAAEQGTLASQIRSATSAAQRFAGLGMGVRDFKRARLDIADINAQIKQLRQQLKGAEGDERGSIKRQIARLILDRADAYGALNQAAGKALGTIRNFNNFLNEQGTIAAMVEQKQRGIADQQKIIRDIQKQIRDMGITDMDSNLIPDLLLARISEARRRIAELRAQMQTLQQGSFQAGQTMANSFRVAVRDLVKIGELPKGITDGMIRDVMALQVKMGRILTRKEMKMVFRALIDPKSMANLPKQVQAFLRRQRKQRVEIEATVKLNRQKLGMDEKRFQAQKGIEFTPNLNKQRVQRQTQEFLGWFKANKKLPPFQASVSPAGSTLGRQLAEGIKAGFGTVNLSVAINATINKTIKDVRQDQEISSPSKKWARLVGAPIGQGVILGMLVAMNSITSEFKRGSPKWRADIRRQLVAAFNQAARDAGQNMADRMREIRDQLQGDFFEGIGELNELRVEWGVILNTRDLTANLQEQIANLRKYNQNWTALLNRKVPLKLLQQLQAMGPEGQAIISALASGSQEDLNAYVRAWQEAQRLLNRTARNQMRQQIRLWRRMGRNIAFGIMAGLRDEEQGMLNYFTRLFRRMFGAAVRFNRSRSPSKRYEGEGRNIVQGLRKGLRSGYGVTVPMPGVAPYRPSWGLAGNNGKMEMHVHAHHSESLMTTMERARFRWQNRR